jgi:hypothetical protein
LEQEEEQEDRAFSANIKRLNRVRAIYQQHYISNSLSLIRAFFSLTAGYILRGLLVAGGVGGDLYYREGQVRPH